MRNQIMNREDTEIAARIALFAANLEAFGEAIVRVRAALEIQRASIVDMIVDSRARRRAEGIEDVPQDDAERAAEIALTRVMRSGGEPQ